MKAFKIVSFLLFVILLLASCSPAAVTPSETVSSSAAASPPASPSETVSPTAAVTIPTAAIMIPTAMPLPSMEPEITEEPITTPEYRWVSNEMEEIGPGYTWELLPGTIPQISDEDMNNFNPEKAMDYLLSVYFGDTDSGSHIYLVHHDYSIESTEVIGSVLYLTITDHRYSYDANSVYEYLKETFGLSDEDILNLPVLSDCYIYDGYMYASKAAWEERQKYDSIEDWESDFEDSVNSKRFSDLTFPAIPVADDALIMPEDGWEHNYLLSTQEYIEYLSNADEIDFPFFKNSNVYVKYENGYIMALFEIWEP